MKPSDFYDERILTLPLGQLVGLFPEFGWKPARGGYVATNDAYCRGSYGKDAKDVEAMPRKGGGRCLGPIVHRAAGGGHGRVLTWVELQCGAPKPVGAAYVNAVIGLAEALGIDHSEISGPRRELSREERAAAEAEREARRQEWERRQALEAEATAAERAARRLEACVAWDQARRVEGSACPAWRYLQTRLGLWPRAYPGERPGADEVGEYPALPESIRCIEADKTLDFEYDGRRIRKRGPLLVALRMVDRVALGVQVIALEPGDGSEFGTMRKRAPEFPGEPAKPFYGPTKDDEGRSSYVLMPATREQSDLWGTLVLCEGIETGWALHVATGCMVACCLSEGGLRAFDLGSIPRPDLVNRVIVAGDHDEAKVEGQPGVGHAAAWACARRLRAEDPDLDVIVAIPDEAGVLWKERVEEVARG